MNHPDRAGPLIERGGSAFIAYLTAGDGGLDYTISVARALVAGGVDLIELGVPFSDPIADGPVIQEAMARALARGASIRDVIRTAGLIRAETNRPVVLFTYANPVIRMGPTLYKEMEREAVDGVLIVDLPPEEADDHVSMCADHGIAPVFVAAPSTPEERLPLLDGLSTGFLYYACRKGTTGVRDGLPPTIREELGELRRVVNRPIAVGFGIGSRSDAAAVLAEADAFVVGSHIVERMGRMEPPGAFTEIARSLDPRSAEMEGEET